MGKSTEKQEFNVLGKVFTVSEERARYNRYRVMYSKMADTLSDKFMKVYMKGIDDIDDIHERGYKQGLLCIFEAITKSVNILVEHKIFDIDEEIFFNEYFYKYYTWDEAFNKVDDRYLSIVCSAEELMEYREARKENRGRYVGGGFGIEGAIKGTLQAGAMNLATGAAYGILNYFENKATEKRVRQEKAALTEDPTVYLTLIEGIRENVFNVQFALYDIIGHLNGKEWDIVSDREEEKVNTLLGNLIRVKSVEDKSELLLQCLQLDPYNTKIYDAILADKSLDFGEIGKICEFFCLNGKAIFGTYFKEILDKCEKTEDGVISCIRKINERMKLYGIADTSFVEEAYKKLESVLAKKYKQNTSQISDLTKLHSYQEEMLQKIYTYQMEYGKFAEKLKKNIEKDLRTYDGVEYKTREERAQVEKNDVEIKEKFNDVKNLSEEQVKELCHELEKGKFSDACKKYCKKEVEKYFDKILKNERIDIDKLSREELLALKVRIQEGRYSKKCKEEFFEKIDTNIQTLDGALKKSELDQLLHNVSKGGLSAINNALNQILSAESLDENDTIALAALIKMQMKCTTDLYEKLIDDVWSDLHDFICIKDINNENLEAYYRQYCSGEKRIELLNDEVPLVLFLDVQDSYNLITNKRMVIGRQAFEIEEDHMVIWYDVYNKFGLYNRKYEWYDMGLDNKLPKFTLLPYIPPEQYRKDINMVKKYKLDGEKEKEYVAKKLTEFLNKVYGKTAEITKMNEIFSKLPTDASVIKSFSKEQLEKEYAEWKKHTQYGSQVANYVSLVEEALKEAYQKEADALCTGLESMSINELEALNNKLDKEFSNKQFASLIEKNKAAVKAELQKKKDMAVREEIAANISKLDSFAKEELESEYSKWIAYYGGVTEVKEYVQNVREALERIYKSEAVELCSGLESLSVKELNELLSKFDEVFDDPRFADCVKDERNSIVAEIARKKDMETREEAAKDAEKLPSLSSAELKELFTKWTEYTGNVAEVETLIDDILVALKAACKKEAQEMCAGVETLSIDAVKRLLDSLKKTFTATSYIEDEIKLVNDVLISKQEQEINEWMPENAEALSVAGLESCITKFNAGHYERVLYDKYILPLLEKRNLLIVKRAEELAETINSKASEKIKYGCIAFESRDSILQDLKRQTEAGADTLVCSIGVARDMCYIYTKRFVNAKIQLPWNEVAYFEFKKKLFGSSLIYYKKNGLSGEIKTSVPADQIPALAELLTAVHSFVMRTSSVNEMGAMSSSTVKNLGMQDTTTSELQQVQEEREERILDSLGINPLLSGSLAGIVSGAIVEQPQPEIPVITEPVASPMVHAQNSVQSTAPEVANREEEYAALRPLMEPIMPALEAHVAKVKSDFTVCKVMRWDGEAEVIKGEKAPILAALRDTNCSPSLRGEKAIDSAQLVLGILPEFFYMVNLDKFILYVKGQKYEWKISDIRSFDFKETLLSSTLIVCSNSGLENKIKVGAAFYRHFSGLRELINFLKQLNKPESVPDIALQANVTPKAMEMPQADIAPQPKPTEVEVPQPVSAPNVPTEQKVAEFKFCIECGQQMKATAKFCKFCGTKVEDIE